MTMPVETSTPDTTTAESVAIEPQTPETPPEPASVADHAAQFSPEPVKTPAEPSPLSATLEQQQRARDEAGRFARERQRPKSQQAKAEDVPRIRELTAKWREAERQLTELRAKQTPQQPAEDRKAPQPAVPSGFTKPKPKIDEFNDQDDPLEAWILAVGDWQTERREFQREQTKAVETVKTAETSVSELERAVIVEAATAYNAREQAFMAKTPGYKAAVDAVTIPTTPLLNRALLLSDNGPELAYYLATHPSVYDEMLLLTDGKTISEQTVALTQRQLASRSQAAPTGSADPVRIARTLPKPPNPVRTGPSQASDEPPGEAGSIADHRRYYGDQR